MFQYLLCHVLRSTFVVLLVCSSSSANNLVISNVTLEDRNASANTAVVEFDISWDHSWRKSDGRHDAAWVFVKLLDGNTGTPTYPWLHGKLYTAGTNPNDGTSVGTNSDIEIVVPSDKIGAFIRRRVTGNGTLSSQNVRLVVDYGTAGAADGDTITAKVYGIEMVYIPEGPFYIGDGDGGETNEIINTASGIYASSEAFISVFDSGGTFQWSERLGGSAADAITSISASASSQVIVAGLITGNADLNGDGDTGDSNETGESGVYATVDAFISVFNSGGTFEWSERLGGTGADSPTNVALTGNSNIVVSGQVQGNSDLNGDGDTADSNETGDTGVYAGLDPFISVFNSAGTFQWSKRLGGTGNDGTAYVSVDSNSNNIVILSVPQGTADVNGDADTADSHETGNTGVYAVADIVISVFDSAGTFQWSERLGGTGADSGGAIAVDSSSNIIVGGSVTGNADLNGDADTADSNETGNTGVYAGRDAFVSVFNSAGTFQWSKRLGGTGTDSSSPRVMATANNSVVVGTIVIGNADLNGDADTGDSNETGNTGVYAGNDPILSVFNSAGTFQWSKRLGGTDTDTGVGIAAASNGNIAFTGGIIGDGDLTGDGDADDSYEVGTSGLSGNTDAFITVFNSAGTFQWSKRLGGSGTDSASGTIDVNGNVIAGGTLSGNGDLNGDADAGSESTYALHQNGVDNTAVQITTTSKNISVDTSSNDDIDTSAVAVDGDGGITGNTSWPVGYTKFYLMKYEISQQQYRDFLNTLDRTQQGRRVAATVSADTVANYYVMSNGTTVSVRQGIRAPASGNGTTAPITFGNDFNGNGTFNEVDDGQNIAMNYISWMDLAAYLDWAGLRPLTELEYEKASRGPNSAVYGEYAWGSTAITAAERVSAIREEVMRLPGMLARDCVLMILRLQALSMGLCVWDLQRRTQRIAYRPARDIMGIWTLAEMPMRCALLWGIRLDGLLPVRTGTGC